MNSETNKTFAVKGMHCASCSYSIEKALQKVDGIKNVQVSYATEKARIEMEPDKINVEKINTALKPLGYSMESMDHSQHNHSGHDSSETISMKIILPVTIITFILMIWDILAKTTSYIPVLPIPEETFSWGMFITSSYMLFSPGKRFIAAVGRFIRYRTANMDTLIGLGTLTAYLYSAFIFLLPTTAEALKLPEYMYFDVTIIVTGFILFGKYLESNSKAKTSEAISKLIQLTSKTCIIEKDGNEVEIEIEKLEVGDIIILKPGSKIPVDGQIIFGYASIDESTITGESMPVSKNVDDKVISGTIMLNGFVKVMALKVGKDTVLSRIIQMVEEAASSKAPIQKQADKIAEIFVPAVLAISIITLITWLTAGTYFLGFDKSLSMGILSFVSILVIACPCALGLATPTAIIVGVGLGAQNGILIKNAESLEKLGKINVLVSDKTGTLTNGKPEVTDIVDLTDANDPTTTISRLASIEKNSEHPLSIAIINKGKEMGISTDPTKNFENMQGKGIRAELNGVNYYAGNLKFVEESGLMLNETARQEIAQKTAQGKTPVVLFTKEKLLGIVFIRDNPKPSAKQAVSDLMNMKIEVHMLTGDNKLTAEVVAKELGINKVHAEVIPTDKYSVVKALQTDKKVVAMAGDGVNDAPALAVADVSIAMANGSDIAIESSDITLLHGDITKIEKAIKLSKATMRTIKENLFWAFIYNIIGIPLAAGLLYPFFGITLNPIFAGAAMAFSSVSVVTNSLRLKWKKI